MLQVFTLCHLVRNCLYYQIYVFTLEYILSCRGVLK